MGNEVARIQDIVGKVRKAFEQKVIPREKLIKLYSKYNPEVDGNAFVAEAEKIFPKLNCGLTTIFLQEVLGGEVIQGKYGTHNHTFLLLTDIIIDITADQYGGPKTYVGKIKFPWSRK